MKDGDVQITRLRRRISHYRVIRDTRPGAYPISIHWIPFKSECVADGKTHLRLTLRVHISDLIPGWVPYDTNTKCTQGHTSPITKNSEMHFILEHCRLNCLLGSLWH
jgi:hypothetical protein